MAPRLIRRCKPSMPTLAAIADVHDGTVGTMKLENQLVQIVRINVVAGFNGSAWRVPETLSKYVV
jgi:hypothetical protein